MFIESLMKSGALNATMMDTARLFFTQGTTTINLIPALAAGLGLGKNFPHNYSTHYIFYPSCATHPILNLGASAQDICGDTQGVSRRVWWQQLP